MPPPALVAVPNLSEGRDEGRIGALVRAVGGALLDRHSDASHHRTVLTLAGSPEALREAALRLFRTALDELDLRRHRGEHPRIGALDVLPVVPLPQAAMGDAAALARRLAEEIAETPAGGIPVFLYGAAGADGAPGRQGAELPEIRRGGLGGLAARLADGRIEPDFGPRRLHPTAGAVAVGARPPLIAFNVDLDTDRAATARRIAARVRESAPGGLPAVRALGVRNRGRAQVSMNLLDFRRTSLADAFDRVRREAERAGAAVAGSEIVGLPPKAALGPDAAADLRLAAPPRALETALEAAGIGGPDPPGAVVPCPSASESR